MPSAEYLLAPGERPEDMLFQADRTRPQDISAGPYGQTMAFQNDRRRWDANCRTMMTAARDAADRDVLRQNFVLRALAGFRNRITFAPLRAQQTAREHPDVPEMVWRNLPALLANPQIVFPHREGAFNLLVSERTAKGEPIVVAIRDGQGRTITPFNDSDDESGSERLARQVNGAISRGQRVYIKDASSAAAIYPTARTQEGTGGYGTVPQRRGKLSRGANLPYASSTPDRQFGWRPPRNVRTFDDVINRQGRVFYQTEAAPPFYSAVARAIDAAKQDKAPAAQWLGLLRNTRRQAGGDAMRGEGFPDRFG